MGAVAGMITGAVIVMIWGNVSGGPGGVFDLYEIVPGFLGNLVVAWAVSRTSPPSEEISEEFDTPVILKMCTRVAHSQSLVETSGRVEPPMKPYEKNIGKDVMMPGNAIRRHPVVEERTRNLVAYAETSPLNRLEQGSDRAMGIITSSTSYQYVKEVFGEEASVLKLGMVHPMPEGLIRDFAAKVDRLAVV